MGVITISNLNEGINVKSDPSAIGDSSLADCIGFDLTKEGILETAGGMAVNDISALLPNGTIQCSQILYIGSTKYVLATTVVGLYANATLVSSGFTGRFKGVSFGNNIYLVNGTQAVRFDGTTCYQWGITAPTSVPTITAAAYLYNTIDLFESLTTWNTNKSGCTIAAEGTIKKEGTQSMKVTVVASATGYSFVPFTTDLTKFSTGANSSEKDYIRLWLYIDNLINLETLNLYFDCGDGTFLNDYFGFTLVSPGLDQGLQALGKGTSSNVIPPDTPETPVPVEDPLTLRGPYAYRQQQLAILAQSMNKTLITPEVSDQILSFWSRSNLFTLKSGAWMDVKVPKSMFVQNGDVSKGWDTLSKVKIEITATSEGAVNVYFDKMELVGGSDLVGEYYFMYSFARKDANNNILHESAPGIASNQYLMAGPITFDRHPLTYAARPISSDPQVNAGLLSCIGGSLGKFWVLAQINDNTTVTDTLYDIGDSTVQRMLYSQRNQPAPAGTDLIVHQNKIWMVGDSNYPRLLRSSDILEDGTLAPEAWPSRNAYDLEGNHGDLTNIRIVNKIPIVKGTSGEWAIQVLDPTDYLQVKAKQVSSLGLIGPDAVIPFETSTIYPSPGGFVESNGASATFIMPEVQPLISSDMSTAVGCNAGLVSYFSYKSYLGNRTAKVDLFRGKPRFSNINNILLDWLMVDEISNKVYAVENGNAYLLDAGYTDESFVGKEITLLLRSKIYKTGMLTSWSRLEIIHNTGGSWWILNVYVDGVLKSSTPFMSTSRTTTNFRDFGPCSGQQFQFEITGTYISLGTIYLPIRIYHGGN